MARAQFYSLLFKGRVSVGMGFSDGWLHPPPELRLEGGGIDLLSNADVSFLMTLVCVRDFYS
jgi:hypothetical protein